MASVACSTRVDGTAEPERVTPPAVQPLACAPREASLCDGVERVTADSPPSAGSIAWAQVITSPTAEGRSGGTPKVAVRGRHAATNELRAQPDLLHHASARARAGDGGAIFRSEDPRRRRRPRRRRSPRVLRPPPGRRPRSFGIHRRRARSAADDRAVEGSITFTHSEWRKVGQTGIYRLHDGSYVEIDLATEAKGVEGGDVTAFSSRKSVVTIGDDLDALRSELLANGGRYELSHGEWLGVALSADRFPMFKNHDYVALPATNEAPAGLRPLYAIETLDLGAEGPISLP